VRLLRIAAPIEALSLVVLLANLATAHVAVIAAICGPLHGCAYLTIAIATLLETSAPTAVRWRAIVPGIGGYLVLRGLRSGASS
jgi:hypothetical protein